jgi:hypothetical protein
LAQVKKADNRTYYSAIAIGLLVTVNLILAIIIIVLLGNKPDVIVPPGIAQSDVTVPPLPGISQSGDRPKILLAQNIDYPPFAFLSVPPEGEYELSGIAVDIARGLPSVCDIEIVAVQTDWANCWDDGKIG